ncbi:acyl-CoA dehydrogenase [Mycolicibacterium sp. 018/SC-01/001]|uniref:acyl-CoA dehydrogenase family protein n=1 Tax=Mycolicibacterium sp. 018/SC-01/001 TaxID=2592069 RepID=UPI00117FB7FD|nr:acyl-CoA dehydrogenase family protein [Mycolicibacterium sp. 018/SC-01/001]TRW86337.1 acyl-CoA dehydrogenase [Mycolicibacterium sp. 018/SC-01/001]
MSVGLVKRWLATGDLDLPLPGRGDTRVRWQRLAGMAEEDVTAGRLAEAHADAVAILAELGGPRPEPGQWWGVWAAEPPDAVVSATVDGDAVRLDGVKAWCSGAGLCSHALVTARLPDGDRGLFAVDLGARGVRPLPSTWSAAGMAESDTRSVSFDNTPAVAVGTPGEYLSRPGFWHGGAGVAACWLGGARAVARPLYRRASTGGDPHALAHLGAVDAALAAADATLDAAAAAIDADPADAGGRGELVARRVRAVVEHAVEEAIGRTARALGPAPLSMDGDHVQRVADLSVYVRQSHAERDLERLGELAGALP